MVIRTYFPLQRYYYFLIYASACAFFYGFREKRAHVICTNEKIRVVWDEEHEKYYFSIVDVIQVLTDSDRPRKYWNDLKAKLIKEGSQVSEKIGQLKMPASDGKQRLTDVADTEQLLRLIQSIPSKKAEPFKLWLAEVGRQRIDQLQDPELSIQQAIADYRRLGYSDNWINQRVKSIETRKELSDGTTATSLQNSRAEVIWVQDPVLNTPMLKVFANPEQGPATAIDEANANVNAIKHIVNGQLLILRGEKTYTVDGREVR